MRRSPRAEHGFTLIEIIIVLTLLGILAATAVPQYLDLQAEADKKAALNTVAEAQVRLELRFHQLLLQGNSCTTAVAQLTDLASVADDAADGNRFGSFLLTAAPLTSAGTLVSVQRTDGTRMYADIAKLYVPDCTPGSTPHSFGIGSDMDAIITEFQKSQRVHLDSEAAKVSAESYASKALTQLAEQGIDLNSMGATMWSYTGGMFYWTTANTSSLKAGDIIPVMRYNSNSGTYTVWNAVIGTRTLETAPGSSPYLVIDREAKHYSASQAAGKDGQTYENALQWYKDAVIEFK